MNTFAGIALASALLLAPGLAAALEQRGIVDQVAPSGSSLTLRDGQEFALAHGLSVDGLQAGTEVVVEYIVVYKAGEREMVALKVQPKTAKTTTVD